MPDQKQPSVPLVWSSKRTIKRMRRMGLIPMTDNNRIEEIASEFVANSTEARTGVNEKAEDCAVARQLFDTPKVIKGKSVEGGCVNIGCTMATSLRLNAEEPAMRDGGDNGVAGTIEDTADRSSTSQGYGMTITRSLNDAEETIACERNDVNSGDCETMATPLKEA